MNDINNVFTASSLVLFADDTDVFFFRDNPNTLEDDICNGLGYFHGWLRDKRKY